MNPQHPQYLEPSELGTKEYWETYYERSLEHIATKTKPRPNTTTTSTSNETNEADEQMTEEEEEDDDDDPGTSWFSEHDAPHKILRYLTSRKFPLSPRNLHALRRKQLAAAEPSILDLGTGNGSMLALLRKRGGFAGTMVGVDYSEQSVRLARELQRLRLHSAYESDESDESDDDDDYDEEEDEEDVVVAISADNSDTGQEDTVRREQGIQVKKQDIQFEEWDILDPANEKVLEQKQDKENKKLPWFPYESQGFDIVLDKGTFDAISLSDATTISGTTANTHICHQYPVIASKLVRPGGFLIVTSCNWTEDELVHWFTTAMNTAELEVWHRLEYPRFRFGGMEGQGVCTVCFRRRRIGTEVE